MFVCNKQFLQVQKMRRKEETELFASLIITAFLTIFVIYKEFGEIVNGICFLASPKQNGIFVYSESRLSSAYSNMVIWMFPKALSHMYPCQTFMVV